MIFPKNGMAYCELTGVENVEGSRGTIDGVGCDKVYCVYPDYGRFMFA